MFLAAAVPRKMPRRAPHHKGGDYDIFDALKAALYCSVNLQPALLICSPHELHHTSSSSSALAFFRSAASKRSVSQA
jgi:hypothetical protein